MSNPKLATPQVPALSGMTPLGIAPRRERPDDIADRAAKASENGDHVEAEKLYLTAAARAAACVNQPTMKKNVKLWDRCASRERRLAELTKK